MLNCPRQTLVASKINIFNEGSRDLQRVTAAVHGLQVRMPQKRFIHIGVVIDRNEIRGVVKSAANQGPRRKNLVVIIYDVDILSRNMSVLKIILNRHQIRPVVT